MANRYEQLSKTMPRELDGMLVWQPQNRRWISGFTGSNGLVVVPRQGQPVFVTDFRYIQQAQDQCVGFRIVEHAREFAGDLAAVIGELGIGKLGFEQDFVTVAHHQKLAEGLKDVADLVPQQDLVMELRSIKTEDEIKLIAKAVEIADKAFDHILGYIRPGLTERQVALELERKMQDLGATAASFEIIVASGPRSSLPHGIASEKVIQQGEFVKLDFGCIYQGYISDTTRTVVLGKASEKQREIYELVFQAQLAALAGIKAGISGEAADALSREVIIAGGYGDNYGHGLGHGIGLAVHEMPRLAPKVEKVLVENNVVTVEPGIYLPQWGGVRIEDDVVVTTEGCRVLTGAPKELIEL